VDFGHFKITDAILGQSLLLSTTVLNDNGTSNTIILSYFHVFLVGYLLCIVTYVRSSMFTVLYTSVLFLY